MQSLILFTAPQMLENRYQLRITDLMGDIEMNLIK
jgi:hypothetical protein